MPMSPSRRRGLVRLALVTAVFALLSTGVALPVGGRPKASLRTIPLFAAGRQADVGWTKTLAPSTPTELVGVQWDGNRAGAVDLRVRTHGAWLPWVTLDANPDEGPDPSSPEHRSFTTAGPAWTGHDVEQIQLRVAKGPLPGLEAHLVHSPSDSQAWGVRGASASPGQPGFISRAQWGADERLRNSAPGCETNPEYASGVRNAFVHHTVNANTYSLDQADDLIRGIYEFHVQANRWCDIGYNFIVDRFGRVYEGRYGGVSRPVIGAHAGGFNSGSTGAAVLGDFRTAAPSAQAMTGLRDLLAWKLAYHGVDPRAQVTVTSSGSTKYANGAVVTLPTIAGHQDVSDTECPGAQMYNRLAQLRIDVQNIILQTPPYPLPGWVPARNQPKLLVMNGYGGLQPAGGQPATDLGGYWAGWANARAIVPDPAGGGWVLDGWGALHPFGGTTRIGNEAYWPGWDIARGAVRIPIPNSGYTLDGYGGVHPFGTAPPVTPSAYFGGWDIARAIVARPDGLGGYTLDGWGRIHEFGTAPPIPQSGYWQGWDIARSLALRPDGISGYVLDGYGGLHAFGGAPPMSTSHYTPGRDEAKSVVLNTDGSGGWVADVNGFVWPFGNAPAVKLSGTWTGSGLGRSLALMQ